MPRIQPPQSFSSSFSYSSSISKKRSQPNKELIPPSSLTRTPRTYSTSVSSASTLSFLHAVPLDGSNGTSQHSALHNHLDRYALPVDSDPDEQVGKRIVTEDGGEDVSTLGRSTVTSGMEWSGVSALAVPSDESTESEEDGETIDFDNVTYAAKSARCAFRGDDTTLEDTLVDTLDASTLDASTLDASTLYNTMDTSTIDASTIDTSTMDASKSWKQQSKSTRTTQSSAYSQLHSSSHDTNESKQTLTKTTQTNSHTEYSFSSSHSGILTMATHSSYSQRNYNPPKSPPVGCPSTPAALIPYVHGSYAAAAPLLLQDRKWMMILKHLMPEAYADARNLVLHAAKLEAQRKTYTLHNGKRVESHNTNQRVALDPVRVMKWAENNPVVAAYGMIHSNAGDKTQLKQHSNDTMEEMQVSHFATVRKLRRQGWQAPPTTPPTPPPTHNLYPALEWDVFLDPILVKHVDRAMQNVDNLKKAYEWSGLSHPHDESLMAANVEVDRQVSRLMSRMMLAHGSTAQLLAEAVGVAKRYNFSRVVEQGESVRRKRFGWRCSEYEDATVEDYRVPPSFAPVQDRKGRSVHSTLAGGIFVDRWLAIFASGLKMGMAEEEEMCASLEDLPEMDGRSRSLQRATSRFLRGSKSSTDSEEDGGVWSGVETFVERQAKEEDVSAPPPLCGLFLCLGLDDPGSLKADHRNTSMAESAKLIRNLLGGKLRLVLDLKSRRVPPRVWSRLIDNLRARGLGIDGIGSFDVDELNSIGALTCTPVTRCLFFHSAGDLQRACHANEIRHGDTVYFNAGSLIWKKPTLMEATGIQRCVAPCDANFSDTLETTQNQKSFQPYAFSRHELSQFDGIQCKATLQDYQQHFLLNIGVYVQEFSIGPETLDQLTRFINDHPSIYNLGLAWGGINGMTIRGVQGDGFWNQRFVGRNWDFRAEPTKSMKLLAPEDHHLFQKVILAGSCGQVSTVNQVLEEPGAALVAGGLCKGST